MRKNAGSMKKETQNFTKLRHFTNQSLIVLVSMHLRSKVQNAWSQFQNRGGLKLNLQCPVEVTAMCYSQLRSLPLWFHELSFLPFRNTSQLCLPFSEQQLALFPCIHCSYLGCSCSETLLFCSIFCIVLVVKIYSSI